MSRRLRISIVMVFAALWSLSLSATTLREQYNKTFDVARGERLVLENVNGSVTVESWDQPRVRIEAERVVKASGAARAKEAMQELRIDVSHDGGVLSVKTRFPKSHDGILSWLTGTNVDYEVTYRITIPRVFDADLETVNGRIEAREIEGRLRFDTTNGGIEVIRSAGSIDASTTNGSIHAELTRVDPAPMRLDTTNGKIVLAIPRGTGATVDASTTNGSIDTDFPISTTSFRRNRISGEINGGGPELRLRTTNGSIRISESR